MTEQAKETTSTKRVGYQGLLLGGFATLATTLLVMGNISTHDTIKQRIAEDLQASLRQVIPNNLHDNNLLDNQISIEHKTKKIIAYQALKQGQVKALAYSVSGQGYAGEIKLIMGINVHGEVLGVRVLSHAETPGLGDKIEVEKDDWIYNFDGLSFNKLAEEKWKVKKDGGEFDEFSGATITPRAVVKAVKEGVKLFHQHRNELLFVGITNKNIENKKVNKDEQTSEENLLKNNTGITNGEPHE